MAVDFIDLQRNVTTATFAGELLSFIAVLNDAYTRGRHLRDIMRHNFDGSDFTQLETLFGIPTGKGQEVFTLMDGAVGSMEGTFQVDAVKIIVERVG